MKWRFRNGSAFVAALLVLALAAAPVLAASTTWKVYIFNASGRALRAQAATVASDGAVNFTFPETADAAYLLTSKVGNFGDLTGTTLTAAVSIVASSDATFANYPGCTSTTTSPTVGLFFQTKSTGSFNPSAYWWSSTRVAVNSSLNTTLSTALVSGDWTNYNGQTDPTGFAAAAANVTSWGVSFGGDCFYANGVGTPAGSAVFTLTP